MAVSLMLLAAGVTALAAPQAGAAIRLDAKLAKSGSANAALTFDLTGIPADVTMGELKLTLPAWLRMSGKGIAHCTESMRKVQRRGKKICAKAQAGTPGEAALSLSTEAVEIPDMYFQPLVRADRTLWVWAAVPFTPFQSVLPGEVTGKGRELAFKFPAAFMHGAGGDQDVSLKSWKLTLGKTGKDSFVTAASCAGKSRTLTARLTFEQRVTPPAAPKPGPVTLNAKVPCKA